MTSFCGFQVKCRYPDSAINVKYLIMTTYQIVPGVFNLKLVACAQYNFWYDYAKCVVAIVWHNQVISVGLRSSALWRKGSSCRFCLCWSNKFATLTNRICLLGLKVIYAWAVLHTSLCYQQWTFLLAKSQYYLQYFYFIINQTYRWSDPPASHACDFEAALLHLITGQFDVKVEFVVTSTNYNMTALLRKICDAGIKLDIAIVLQSLSQSDELWDRI